MLTAFGANEFSYCTEEKFTQYILCFFLVGIDCSVDLSRAHWSAVPFLSSISLDLLSRAGHSAVVLDSFMLVYSGYRFSGGRSNPYTVMMEDRDLDAASLVAEGELLRYDLRLDRWEVLNSSSSLVLSDAEEEQRGVQSADSNVGGGSGAFHTGDNSTDNQPALPHPRYGHSAVIYNVSGFFKVKALVIVLVRIKN